MIKLQKQIAKTIQNKTNSNKKDESQIWQIKISIGDEIKKIIKLINYCKYKKLYLREQ